MTCLAVGCSDDAAPVSTSATDATSTGVPGTVSDPTTDGSASSSGSPSCEPSEVVMCDDLLALPSFCVAVDKLAEDAGVKDPYAQIVVDMCEDGDELCSVCFNLANYCAQVGTNCGEGSELRDRCVCAGLAFGMP